MLAAVAGEGEMTAEQSLPDSPRLPSFYHTLSVFFSSLSSKIEG
jgi:hypothetical protein